MAATSWCGGDTVAWNAVPVLMVEHINKKRSINCPKFVSYFCIISHLYRGILHTAINLSF